MSGCSNKEEIVKIEEEIAELEKEKSVAMQSFNYQIGKIDGIVEEKQKRLTEIKKARGK